MTAGCEQLRMVKRRCLIYRALISQGVAQEINQILLVLQGQAKDLDIRVHVLNFWNCIEVAAAVVELNHLLQCQLAAIVEIRSSQSDVAQLRRLEETGPGDIVSAVHGRRRKAITTPAGNYDGFKAALADFLAQVFRLRERKTNDRVGSGKAHIFSRWPYANVIEAGVINAGAVIFHDHALHRHWPNSPYRSI